MIIGFDGSRVFLSERTGTENYSYQILRALSKVDRKNSYIVYLRPNVVVDEKEWPDKFKFKTIPFPYLWTQVGLSLQTFIDKIDVLFVPAHTIPLIYKPGLKTVVTVHDLGSEYLPHMHQLKQRLYLSFMQKLQLKMANKLIAVSESTKGDLIKRLGIEHGNIEVIYEGLNNLPKPDINILVNILRHYDLVKGEYFIFVGTIQPRKNLERLIKAFKDIPQPFKLVLVGSKGWLSDDIYDLPGKLNIKGRVKFLGRVNDQSLSALYSAAIGLVFPSLFEGFGLPILEAFDHKIPVITSNISSMPEVAGKGAILIDPESIDQIKDAMLRLIKDGGLRKRLVIEGQRQLQKFSWEECARRTLKLIEGANDVKN